ncbi:MAG: hypothetical protein K2R98_18410 [Gemmataceae bacterium]|nr:hypothetical protein [Gemmataceae bacterium]
MQPLDRPSVALQRASFYTAAGLLVGIWTGIYFWFLSTHPGEGRLGWIICTALALAGMVLIGVGLRTGRPASRTQLPQATIVSRSAPIQSGPVGYPMAQPVGQVGMIRESSLQEASADETPRCHREMSGTMTVFIGVMLGLVVAGVVQVVTGNEIYTIVALPAVLVAFVALTKWL